MNRTTRLAAAALLALGFSGAAHAGPGLVLQGTSFNGFTLNGLQPNGFTLNGLQPNGQNLGTSSSLVLQGVTLGSGVRPAATAE
jgi:hypothetical protein